jgi:uncharacterized surface protein with fasciclin (FAS1) repeats
MRKLSLLLVIFALFAVMLAPVAAQDEVTIGEIVVASTEADAPEFTILLAAVGAADPSILELLTDPEAQLTVFAPTDAAFAAAFEALGVTAADLLANADLLNAVLAYHVVPSIYDAASLIAASADGAMPVYGTMLPNAGVTVMSSDMGVMVNEATVATADIMASNGVVHVIDSVLLPDLEALPMMDEMEEEPTLSIAETVVAAAGADAPEFTTLLAAVGAADPAVLEALTNGGPFTVFAPTDAAFAAALEALGVTAEDVLADTELVTTILAYHVVPGTWSAAGVVGAIGEEGALVGTVLPGTTLSLMLDGDSVMVNDATVVATDIITTNGIVHVIDAVLLPPM